MIIGVVSKTPVVESSKWYFEVNLISADSTQGKLQFMTVMENYPENYFV